MVVAVDGGGGGGYAPTLPPPPPPPPPNPPAQDRAADRISRNLDDSGFFGSVSRGEAKDAAAALTELNGTDAGAVIDRMQADGTLAKFARETVENQDGWFGPDGMSRDEHADFLRTMAQRLDGPHLATLANAYKEAGGGHEQRVAEAVARNSPAHAQLDFVRALAPATTDGGKGGVLDGDYVDADAQAVGTVLSAMRGNYATAGFGELSSDELAAVMRSATGYSFDTITSGYGATTVADTTPDRFEQLLEGVRSISDVDTRAAALGAANDAVQLVGNASGKQDWHVAPLASAVIGALDTQALERMGPEVAADLADIAVLGEPSEIAATLSDLTRLDATPSRDAMIRTIFLKTPQDAYEDDSALAGAMGSALAATTTTDPYARATNAARLSDFLGRDEGRALLADDKVDPSARLWAAQQVVADPARIGGMIEGQDKPWEAAGVVELHAAARIDRFALARGNETVTLSGGSDFANFVGAGLGAPTRGDLPTDATALQGAQADAARGNYDFFAGVDAVQKPAEGMRNAQQQLGGGDLRVSVLPVQFSSQESGPVDLQLYRVENAAGESRFVDNVGRIYSDFGAWKRENDLPPGQMTYPADGALDAVGGTRLETANTPNVSDSFWEHVGDVADVAALVGGVVASGVILVGSGGTATPLVAGAWTVALGSAAYTGARAAADLHDRAQHGQSLSLTDGDARAAWLSLAGSGLTVAGAGVTRLAGLAASESALATNGARAAGLLNAGAIYTDAAATVDTATNLVANWDRMTPGERAQMGLQIAFWGGMTGASARIGGGGLGDAFSFRAQINHAMLETGAAVRTNAALRPGEASVTPVRDASGQITDIRVESGPGTSRAVIDAHTAVARDLIANSGVAGVMRRTFGDPNAYAAGTRGEEVSLEVAKHEAMLREFDTQLARTDLAPADRTALARSRADIAFDLNGYRTELATIRANPALGSATGTGHVDVKRSAQHWLDPNATVPRDAAAQTSFAALRTDVASAFPNAQRVQLDASGGLTLADGTVIRNFGDHTNRLDRFVQPQADGGYGGALFYDRASGTVIAAVNMRSEANPNLVTRVEVPFARNAAGEWRADFSRLAPYSTSIDPTLPRVRDDHFRAANENLRASMASDSSLAGRLGLTAKGQKQVDNATTKSPEPYTWHHVNGGGDIQLVDSAIHGFFLHNGGFSEWAPTGTGN